LHSLLALPPSGRSALLSGAAEGTQSLPYAPVWTPPPPLIADGGGAEEPAEEKKKKAGKGKDKKNANEEAEGLNGNSLNIHSTFIQHSFYIHSTFAQYSRGRRRRRGKGRTRRMPTKKPKASVVIHSTFIQHSFYIHSTFAQNSQNIHGGEEEEGGEREGQEECQRRSRRLQW
jgi:hypothetical protein